MNEIEQKTDGSWWKILLLHRIGKLQQRQDQLALVLALVIGAVTGLAVVTFIVLTERLGMRLYPTGSAPWRRLLLPMLASVGSGYLLFRFFPNARGSGVPQAKAAIMQTKGASCRGPCWASSSVRPQHWPAESHSDAKDLPFKLGRVLLQCSDGFWG
jgi:hypothetical protein